MKKILVLIIFTSVVISNLISQVNRRGLEFIDQNRYLSIPLAIVPLQGQLQSEVDLSAKFPPIGNQGQQGSCVGWATSNLKAYQENVSNNVSTFKFSPAYIYNQIKLCSDNCLCGSYVTDAINVLTSQGCALETFYPYDQSICSNSITTVIRQNAANYPCISYQRCNGQDPNELKSHLASGYPILIGIRVDDAFQAYRGGIFSNWNSINEGGHAMVVVGYSEAKKAFKICNSWGTSWGENGYIWISYAAFNQNIRESYIVFSNLKNPNPFPNPTQAGTRPLFRWFNYNGDHFYTLHPTGEQALQNDYRFESIECYIYPTFFAGTTPLHRYYNTTWKKHFYSTNDTATEYAKTVGFMYEGDAGYVFGNATKGTIPLYRWFKSSNGDHFYTTTPNDPNPPIYGYVYETIACYVFSGPYSGVVVTKVSDIENDKLDVYPNPFANKITFKNLDRYEKCELRNSIGQIIWVGTNIEQEDFSKLINGMYILTIYTKNQIQAVKLMKQ